MDQTLQLFFMQRPLIQGTVSKVGDVSDSESWDKKHAEALGLKKPKAKKRLT